MDRNIKIAKDLIRIARSLVALDEEGDGSGFQRLHDVANFQEEEQDREIQRITQSMQKSIDESQRTIEEGAKAGKKYILFQKVGTLWRIVACKSFGNVRKGERGGLVESEKNLLQRGDCWIYDGAKVYGDAVVCDSAKVYGGAEVFGESVVCDNAEVFGDGVKIEGKSEIYGDAKVDYSVKDEQIDRSRTNDSGRPSDWFTDDQEQEYQRFIKSKMPRLANWIRHKFGDDAFGPVYFIEHLGWDDWGGIGFDVDDNGTKETYYIGYNCPDAEKLVYPWYAGFSVDGWEEGAYESRSYDNAVSDLIKMIEEHRENQM